MIYPKELTCSLNRLFVSQHQKPRQTTIAFVSLLEITILDNQLTHFCLNMIPGHVLKLPFPTRPSIFLLRNMRYNVEKKCQLCVNSHSMQTSIIASQKLWVNKEFIKIMYRYDMSWDSG